MIRILGIDPGSRNTGYGIIDLEGNHSRHVTHGTIRLTETEIPLRLGRLFRELGAVIDEFQPQEIAIERVFLHKNADSALKLGQARGSAITACADRDLPVYEYTANQIKQATTGRGHATKDQVQHMIRILLCLNVKIQADASDALAIALCHGHSREGLLRMSGVQGIRGGRLQ